MYIICMMFTLLTVKRCIFPLQRTLRVSVLSADGVLTPLTSSNELLSMYDDSDNTDEDS